MNEFLSCNDEGLGSLAWQQKAAFASGLMTCSYGASQYNAANRICIARWDGTRRRATHSARPSTTATRCTRSATPRRSPAWRTCRRSWASRHSLYLFLWAGSIFCVVIAGFRLAGPTAFGRSSRSRALRNRSHQARPSSRSQEHRAGEKDARWPQVQEMPV